MEDGITMSNHISNLRPLRRQLEEVKARVDDDDDARAILLNNLPTKYSNVIFTLSQTTSQKLEDMISAILVEEMRTNEKDAEGMFQLENVLYVQNHNKISSTRNEEIKCYYCKKKGHIAWSCKTRARDVLKGNLKDEGNITCVENEDSSNDEVIICDSFSDPGKVL